jgi:hypothetical protein
MSYGVSITSVEDVFLKISGGEHFGSEEDTAAKVGPDAAGVLVKGETLPRPGAAAAAGGAAAGGATTSAVQAVRALARKEQGGLATFLRHTGALLTKRWNYARRDCKGLLCQIFLPAIMIAGGLGLIQSGTGRSFPDYQLSTAQFNTVKRTDPN